MRFSLPWFLEAESGASGPGLTAAGAPGPLAVPLLSPNWAGASSVWGTLRAPPAGLFVYGRENKYWYVGSMKVWEMWCIWLCTVCVQHSSGAENWNLKIASNQNIRVFPLTLASVCNRYSRKSSRPGISVGLSSPGLPRRSTPSRVHTWDMVSKTISLYPGRAEHHTWNHIL